MLQNPPTPIFKRKRCKDRPSPYKCSCGKSYQTKDALSKHKKDVHKEKRNSICDRKVKKFEGQKGRPSLKKHDSNKSIDYESSLMEEEIYEKTLLLLLETEISLQVNKHSIICNPVEEFSNLFSALKAIQKNPHEVEIPEIECFLKEICSQKIKLEEENIATKRKHNETQPAVKKLAFLMMKSADFLKPVFLQYFLLLNMDILRSYLQKSSLSRWYKSLLFYDSSDLTKVFEKSQLLEFNKRHEDNVVAFLNKGMPIKQEVFRF